MKFIECMQILLGKNNSIGSLSLENDYIKIYKDNGKLKIVDSKDNNVLLNSEDINNENWEIDNKLFELIPGSMWITDDDIVTKVENNSFYDNIQYTTFRNMLTNEINILKSDNYYTNYCKNKWIQPEPLKGKGVT
ncbi:hypothetical protein LOS1_00050 [Campylobacter phage vB_CjeM_Los1]|uniref:Uncharacterized protein n=1 Tax=Campylobacter phage vB_CjeM_Los1 TaxID=1904491 RepID=A0A1D8EXC1_9CAUD|nr:hypothetical protein FDH13_gp050 [Campylobacter phage vB_CjeM_Los1]AOT25871.1 hypothetical protein LOS1_00050 [Campylobacter phage vB_CjeM_Los1]